MLEKMLIYISSILIVAIISIIVSKNKILFKYFATSAIALSSFAMLITIVSSYSEFGKGVLSAAWQLPFAKFAVGFDALSLFFMIPLLILTISCSLYGSQYFKNHSPGILHWLNYSLLVVGMIMVLFAKNAILFIIAWEIMSFASFLLVITESDKPSVRRAGWIYFITAHIGTAFLLTLFLTLANYANSFDFSAFYATEYTSYQSNLIFIFALIAFGMKAGFIPFHIWLPLAHPAAPSHVSALMSGIMIKMGIYGILRVILFLGGYPAWWAILLLVIGFISGVLGILFASTQPDMKKLLGYCSVENMGIILIGLGVGMLGVTYKSPMIAFLGFSGAMLHILNHSIFKALLFLGAGAVIRQTGTGELNKLGGLIKKMPWTANLFLLGSIAITGLPFFNGFISEILIYSATIYGTVAETDSLLPMLMLSALVSLALIGGLSIATFTKLFGIVFLGSARDEEIVCKKDIPKLMRFSMIFLLFFIVFITFANSLIIPYILQPVELLIGNPIPLKVSSVLNNSLNSVTIILGICLGLFAIVSFIRFVLLKRNAVTGVETWGCGYTKGDVSMQYTGSSFSEPISTLFKTIIPSKYIKNFTKELFPRKNWRLKFEMNDWILNNIYIPTVKFIDKTLSLFRWIQCGRVGIYVLYIVLTLLSLIIWGILWK